MKNKNIIHVNSLIGENFKTYLLWLYELEDAFDYKKIMISEAIDKLQKLL